VSNVLSEEKKQQVIVLGRLGWSLRRIQQATRIRRETAAGYLKAAGIPIRAPGGWGRKPATAAKPAIEVATDPAAEKPPDLATPEAERQPGRSPTSSACEPYREVIELGLSRGRNAMAIWQDLVDDHGFTGRYNSVKRFVGKLRGITTPEARVVIETAAGEEAQVDYGDGPMVRDPNTGKYRRMRMFVLTLGHSRKSVRLLVFRSSTQTWAELHEKAFRRLGGATRVVVLDNLREGVLTPDLYDPALNPLYRDVLKHYGAVALPCRVNDPDRKGKVESGVGHAQKTPLKGLRFETPEQAQAYLDRWEERWADTRIHGTTKRQVAAMFAEEKPALLALPVEPFRYYQYGERTVHLDGCVEVEAAYLEALAESADMLARLFTTRQQLPGGQRCLRRTVFVFDPVPATLLAQVLAQQIPGQGIEQANVGIIPLHLHATADPAGRRAIVSRIHLHTAVQMHCALAVLVIAERFDGQRQ
jgi:transposase